MSKTIIEIEVSSLIGLSGAMLEYRGNTESSNIKPGPISRSLDARNNLPWEVDLTKVPLEK